MLSKKALSINPSPTMAIDSKAKEMKSQGLDVIGFGAGEPDFDTPEHIREAAIRAINEGYTRYTPAAGIPELKEAICNKLKVENGLEYSPAEIVVSNGAKHSVYNVLCALLNPGDEVLIPVPYWVSYPEMVKLADGIPVAVESAESNCLKVTLDVLGQAATPSTKALILNSPSNPTGQVLTREELKGIAQFCLSRGIYIIADEIYEHLIYGEERHISIATFDEKIKDLTIVVNGVSKTYAMTGWRIGYTASNAELAKTMTSIQSQTTSNPCSISQKAALAALTGPQECVGEMLKAFDERRKYMYERIINMPYLDALEPMGTFYLFAGLGEAVGKKYRGRIIENSDQFAGLMLEIQNVAVVPGSGFGAPNYMRLSFATSMENIIKGLDRLEAFLSELE
ncbi:MAG: pyridoxal phosphate-dependent aminotransferase [Bacillota bacterium]|nr:pyridoxal phosphate-dependent aminotransferase [Bacillota bacterium]